MSLEEQIDKDYILAMKARDTARSGTLSFLRAQLKYARIELKTERVEDKEVIVVLKKQIKQRQDSIEQFKQGGRTDLVGKEEQELGVLKSYLPAEMSAAEIDAVQKAGRQYAKDIQQRARERR